VHQRLPSQRVIKLDCIIVEQIPSRTIAASPERFLTTFLTPKGRDCGSGGNEQSDGRTIKGGPRTSVANDRLSWSSVGFPVATPNATSNQFGDVEASGWPAQVRTSPIMPIVHPLIGSELRSLQLVSLVHKRRPQDDHAATPRGAPDFLQ
jgi:hypothetical protein